MTARRLIPLLTVAGFAAIAARAELSATDGFESSAGDWASSWQNCSQFDGGVYTNTASKITGPNSLGLFGNGGANGTGVRRAFTSAAGQIRFQWSYRADYDVTSDDGNAGLNRRMAFTLRAGNDADHFTGQRLSFFFAEGNTGFGWYDGTDHFTNAVTFGAGHVYDCAVTVSTGLRTYTLSVSNRNTGATFTYSGSWTTGSAGDHLDSVSFLMRGPSGVGNDAFLDNVSVTQAGVPWPGGATAGYASDPANRIHHYKEQAVLGNGYILCMLDGNGSLYDIYYPSVGTRHGSGTANEGYRGPEEFPACSLDAQANGQMNVINAMGGIGLIAGGTNSIHWLKNQFGTDYTSVGQRWLSDDVNVVLTTNKLNIAGNSILVEQYDFVPSTDALPVITDGARTNYGVYIKRFRLTNLEATDRTIDFYYDANFNVKGANMDDTMYFETTVGATNYNAMVVYDNAARTVTGTGCSPNGYGDDGFGNFDASKNYNPTSYGSYNRNASVYFATVMKVVTNASSGLGLPAEGSWRDHTPTDNQEGWLGRRITLPAGQPVEVDVMIVGSWDDAPGQSGTHDFWGRPVITWFYNANIATVQSITENYWSNWVNSGVTIDFPGDAYDRLWKRQLLIAATHQDKVTGAIIAGSHNGAYPFCWPRDGAYAAITFARTGHTNEALRFIHFLNDVAYRDFDTGIGDKGFFYQKYTTDGYQVWTAPQVDETASVPWALFYLYSITGDAGFLSNHWNLAYTSARASSEDSAINPGGLYYDDTFNLMFANNVWEDQNMLTVYGNASVVRGLYDAANIADIVGQAGWASTFRNRAATIRDAGITPRLNANVEAADISLLGLTIPYEVFEPNDPKMTNLVEKIHGRQTSCGSCPGGPYTDNLIETTGDIAGLVRRYTRKSTDATLDNYWNGGPWFLSTSWYAEYFSRWQDYVAGKQLINTNLYVLNLLAGKMDNLLIGAEQIAPSGQEKYPGFRLQTSWPNLWEADTTLIDQMAMFLDYKPQATNNTCYFAPKLPSGWSTITFNNLLFKNQRFNITVSEGASYTRADIHKLTAGSLNYDLWLRIPPGETPAIVITNGALCASYTFDSTARRVRVQGPLTATAGLNSIVVTYGNNDSDGDGLPDAWETQYGLDPLDNGSGNPNNGPTGDPDGDGMNNLAEFLCGTDPTNSASAFRIVSIVRTNDDLRITWTTAAGKTNALERSGSVATNYAAVFTATNTAAGTTNYLDTGAATNSTERYYRVRLVP